MSLKRRILFSWDGRVPALIALAFVAGVAYGFVVGYLEFKKSAEQRFADGVETGRKWATRSILRAVMRSPEIYKGPLEFNGTNHQTFYFTNITVIGTDAIEVSEGAKVSINVGTIEALP